MALNVQSKKNIINKISKISKSSVSAIIANPKNICSNLLNQLRKNSRKNDVIIYMIKNTLLKIAINNTNIECLNKQLKGPILIGFSIQTPESAIKLFTQFSKKNKNFKIITACYNKKILSIKEINDLSNLPTYQEAIIRFMITIHNATIRKILNILLSINNNKKNK
ncbi:50S ribosomal protein L10 [Buchnera aphidicola (Pterocallis alni)]|uniref:50S ribosomal protein L10 n=1 Tax=Buchnera aphidicola TaxID=9 RepID=UPI003464428A